MQARNDPSDATSTTDETLTESWGWKTPETTPPAAARPYPAPPQSGPDAANMHTEPNDDTSGDNPSPDILATQDREIIPSPAPRPPHAGDHLDVEELRRVYDTYHQTRSPNLVDALRVHFQGVCGDRQFAAALLPHGPTNIHVRHLQALLTLGQQTLDDLVDAWIWWFNCHLPDHGRVWVPHLAWAHTRIAPKEGPYQNRPLLYPFHHIPSLLGSCSSPGSA